MFAHRLPVYGIFKTHKHFLTHAQICTHSQTTPQSSCHLRSWRWYLTWLSLEYCLPGIMSLSGLLWIYHGQKQHPAPTRFPPGPGSHKPRETGIPVEEVNRASLLLDKCGSFVVCVRQSISCLKWKYSNDLQRHCSCKRDLDLNISPLNGKPIWSTNLNSQRFVSCSLIIPDWCVHHVLLSHKIVWIFLWHLSRHLGVLLNLYLLAPLYSTILQQMFFGSSEQGSMEAH